MLTPVPGLPVLPARRPPTYLIRVLAGDPPTRAVEIARRLAVWHAVRYRVTQTPDGYLVRPIPRPWR